MTIGHWYTIWALVAHIALLNIAVLLKSKWALYASLVAFVIFSLFAMMGVIADYA